MQNPLSFVSDSPPLLMISVYQDGWPLPTDLSTEAAEVQGSLYERCLFIVHCKENPIYVFPEKKPRGLSSNFHIHVSVSNLYIPIIGLPIFSRIGRPIAGIYKSLTETWIRNWERGGAVLFLVIFVSNFRYSVFAVCIVQRPSKTYFNV